MNLALIASRQDIAGMNIAKQIDFLPIYYVDCDIINAENVDKKLNEHTDFIIFISKHRGAKSKMLSVHAPGNFKKADFGGQKNQICKTSSFILKTFFQTLNKLTPHGWTSTLEITHHGPYIEKPCLFVEIGSSEEDWKNKKAAQSIAKTIQQSIEKINNINNKNYIPAIAIGGPHYCPNFNKIQLNSKYALSHIISGNQIPITKEMIKEAINKTQEKVETAIIDWKGLKSADRQEVVKLLKELNLKVLRTSEVEK